MVITCHQVPTNALPLVWYGENGGLLCSLRRMVKRLRRAIRLDSLTYITQYPSPECTIITCVCKSSMQLFDNLLYSMWSQAIQKTKKCKLTYLVLITSGIQRHLTGISCRDRLKDSWALTAQPVGRYYFFGRKSFHSIIQEIIQERLFFNSISLLSEIRKETLCQIITFRTTASNIK